MAVDAALAKSYFLNASDIADTIARAAYLEKVCGANAELLARVEALLLANDGAPLPPHDGPEANSNGRAIRDKSLSPLELGPKLEVGEAIADRYTLVEPIGEGGMGEVWVAEQAEPVGRTVALKVIKTGMDSWSVIQRFEMERKALALMDHPNIAKVLDAGLTPNRQPFFVMELVNGLPLTKFCDELKLGLKERLELFVPVCQAVQHAHQKGIVHRDLKPANILVAVVDGKPVPKVIDFGVAKAIEGKLADLAISTYLGSIIGTFEYMAPEQAGMVGEDVDTRADIYSLGVILYEMLTGLKPLDSKRLQESALLEQIRLVREEEPSKPSTRLSTDDARQSLAAMRRAEPRRLATILRGELDWVVMKCLEKQRERRYETANALARDIQRYLANETVDARPPSTSYRLKKLLSRNKVQVVAASLVLSALLVGIAGTSWGLIEARRHYELAIKAKKAADERAEGERLAKLDAQARRAEVETQRKRAEEEKEVAQAVKDFLRTKLLAQADPARQADSLLGAGVTTSETKVNPTVRDLLDRAAKELAPEVIEQSFPNQQMVQAEILATVGNTYRGIGAYPPAIDFLTRSLDLRSRQLGPGHPDTLADMSDLAWAYLDDAKFDQAIPLFEKVLMLRKAKHSPDDPDVLLSMHNLAAAYDHAGKLDLALPLSEETLRLRLATLGPKDMCTLASMNNLAAVYHHLGKFEKAAPLLEETLRVRKATLGAEHPDTLRSMHNLAATYRWAPGKFDLALRLMEETLPIEKAKLGPEHPDTLTTMANLGEAYMADGKRDLALPLMEETIKMTKATLGLDHPTTLRSMNNLAGAYWSLRQLDKSIPLFETVLPFFEKKLGRDNPETIAVGANLGVNYKDAGQLAKAIPLLEEGYRGSLKYPQIRWVGMQLIDAYAKAGENAKLAKLLPQELAEARKTLPKDDPRLPDLLAMIGRSLLQANSFAEAEPLFRECLALREKTHPDHWITFDAKSHLGAALLGQKKYADAEPLLISGYEGMKQREQTIPPEARFLINEADDRLTQLKAATGKKADQSSRVLPRSSIHPSSIFLGWLGRNASVSNRLSWFLERGFIPS